jgi:hypothetical protein
MGVNKLKSLIKELWPNGVEYINLEKIVNLVMGISPWCNIILSNPHEGIEFHQEK